MEANDRGDLFQAEDAQTRPSALPAEETLVTDARAGVSPAQMVERKLASLLVSVPVSVSQMMDVRPRRPHS